ncbi:peptide chain release factor 2 [Puniceicoccales bacterium CK1056]|uniref:Peptide chain release factor 2 n=1 Tax=Oceanipulchritudo coccoides TaxID=2706888 RepID=A0A6B2M509_9BACT|nr:peptide chain release factor 2 [Oceanipulchritudo coccoides]NDV63446.1 peptide chain release factor 2 [Oceanipulchritudo coccoides]
MVIDSEIRNQLEEITRRAGHLWRYLDVPKQEEKIASLEEKMAQQDFWDHQEAANKVVTEVSHTKARIQPIKKFHERIDDVKTLVELVEDADDEDGQEYFKEIVESVGKMVKDLDALEIQSFLGGKMDRNNAILSINAGAGGTESCDWADMLYRMYVRWAERSGYTVETDDLSPGEEAGISHATIRIIGANAYGYAKAERGVHRLVRISPFDSNARRHTSFCAVDVIAELDDDIDVEIKDEDLRVDTYRASGKGGQHVNKTDSAVRMTHLPTNIVVQCQNERSQLKNRATALKMLKSRLYEKYEDEKRAEMEKFYGAKGEIGWGNQIRSYVFQPYQMVKDLRTGVDTSNIQQVMDGDLDRFIHAWLRAGCPTSRNKDIKIED